MEKTNVCIKTGNSDSHVDGQKTAEQLKAKIKEIEEKGLSNVSIEPRVSGNCNFKSATLTNNDDSIILPTISNAGGWGYGYSFTSRYIIIAKKNELN